MNRFSIQEAEARDAIAKPNATDFCATIRTIADGLSPSERRCFLAGARRAAELCGHSVFSFHLQAEEMR